MDKYKVTLGNGTEIAYLERPGEIPLVLLHGITDNARTYETLLERIDPRCRVYALDHRGHGDSAKPESLYDTDAYADDVRHFIDEVAGSPVLLQGHSLGGLVAVQVARTAPDSVRALFLEDPPLYFVDDLNDIYRTIFEGTVMMATTLQDASRTISDWFEVMAAAPDPYSGLPGIETMGEEKILQRLESISQMKPKAMIDALAGSLEWDTDEVLAGVNCPVTMINGNEDIGAVISEIEAARATEIIGECQVIRYADAGHLVHDIKPDEWVAALNSWINTHQQ